MDEDRLNAGLAPSDVFQRLRDGLRKISKTDGISFVEAYVEDARVRIEIEPKNHGSGLKISYDFTKYWIMLTLVILLLIPVFLLFDKFLFGGFDPISVVIPLIMLVGWYFIRGQNEKKKKEKILNRVMAIVR